MTPLIYRTQGSSGDQMSVSLAHGSTAGVESYSWDLPVPSSSIVSTGTGRWKIAPPSTSTSPLVSMSLSFSSSAKSAGKCSSGSEEIYTGSLTGLLKVATGFKALGTVGGKSLTFKSSKVLVNNGCTAPSSPTHCSPGGSVFAFGSSLSAPSLGASFNSKHSVVSLSRYVVLSKAKSWSRFDTVTDVSAPGATLSSSSVDLTTRSGAIVTGSDKTTGHGTPYTTTRSCVASGVTKTEKMEFWSATTSVTSLVAHFIYGKLSATSFASAELGWTTVS